jgi:zinc protease
VFAMDKTGPAPGYFTVLSQTQPNKIDEVIRRIRANLGRAKKGDIAADEFRTAVDQIIAYHAQENTTIGEQAQLSALNELYGLGYDYDKTFDARIRAVTLEEVIRVARKYLDREILVTTSP